MRPTILFSLAAASLLVTSNPNAMQAAMTGTFRLVISSPRTTPSDGLLVLEDDGQRTSGTLVLSENHASILSNVIVSDTLITANLKTTEGPATLQLHVNGREVAGEIVRNSAHFTVVGRRTN